MIYFNDQPFNHSGYDLVVKINEPIKSLKQLYDLMLQRKLLPPYFGGNIDAFDDSIWGWMFEGKLNAIINFRDVISLDDHETKLLASVLKDHNSYWRQEDKVFDVYFAHDDGGVWQKAIEKAPKPATKKERNELSDAIRKSPEDVLEETESTDDLVIPNVKIVIPPYKDE